MSWFTVQEYAKQHGICKSTADQRLRKLWRAGKLERVQRREERVWGKWEQRPVVNMYREKP